MKKLLVLLIFALLFLGSCTFEKAVPLPAGCTTTMYYATDIKPFIDSKCVICHSSTPSYMNGGDFTDFNHLKEVINDGTFKDRVFNKKDMAPTGYEQLTEAELGKLRCWIDQGAPNN